MGAETLDEPLLAYNLTVEGFHTYFVAANENAAPVWVHNANCDLLFRRGISLDDPSLSGQKAIEASTASRLGEVTGDEYRILKQVNERDGDFVSASGVTFDALGQPKAYQYWNESAFLNSIDDHILKSVDHIIIDLSGANQAQISIIISHVSNSPLLTAANLGKVIYVY